jgi:arylsulfatase A-like enzyme
MADDQGWGDMGYNGHPILKTPHFDAMAAEGLRFDHFYAAAPVCTPTRGSVMTGRHPNRFGCFKWGWTLRPQEVTVAEALQTAGYATGHFGKWHLGSVQADSPVSPGNSGFDHWVSAPNFFENNPTLSREGKAEEFKGESSEVTVDLALEFLKEQVEAEKPFLAVVWFGSPHKPHIASEEDFAAFPDQDKKMRNFLGELRGMDRAFGKLRGALGEMGIRENTLLWYCSDNGGLPEVGRTGGRGNKGQVWEGGLRVPAVLEWPAVLKAPAATDMPCITSDILPTVLAAAGVEHPTDYPLDGTSLLPLLSGDTVDRGTGIGFWDYPAKGVGTPSEEMMQKLLKAQQAGEPSPIAEFKRMDAAELPEPWAEDHRPGHAAWLAWPWKLHRIPVKDHVKYALYNLEADPMESDDLLKKEPDRAGDMKAALAAWQDAVAASYNGEDYR